MVKVKKSHIPAAQEIIGNKIIRTFSNDVHENELKWHWDEKDRNIRVLNSSDWYIQFDNDLPIKLSHGKELFIKAGEWHRVIKGSTDLKVEIVENQ